MASKNRFEFFVFKGKAYGVGTVVKFKEEYMKEVGIDADCKYGKLTKAYYLKKMAFFEYSDKPNYPWPMGGEYVLSKDSLEDVIEEILMPIEIPYVSPTDKKFYSDWEIPGMIEMWIVYLFFMGVASIFRCNVIFWAIISFIFFTVRYDKKKEHGYK